MVYSFFYSLAYRAHSNDHSVCVRSTYIVKRLVASACHLADLVHVFNDDLRDSLIELVRCFSSLEEYVRILCRTSDNRVFRIESLVSEFLYCVPVYQFLEVVIAEHFDLLDLM